MPLVKTIDPVQTKPSIELDHTLSQEQLAVQRVRGLAGETTPYRTYLSHTPSILLSPLLPFLTPSILPTALTPALQNRDETVFKIHEQFSLPFSTTGFQCEVPFSPQIIHLTCLHTICMYTTIYTNTHVPNLKTCA